MSEDSLLPFNASELEKNVEGTICRAADIPLPIESLWNPNTCPENVLPWLAWALSVDTWDSAWPVATKRRVIADSVLVHRTKGTLSAIRRALRGLNIQADISEWFQHGGPPHTFQLTAWTDEQVEGSDAPILDASLYRNLARVVNNVKPVRSHYEFNVGARFNAEFQFGSSALSIIHRRVDAVPQVQTGAVSIIGIPLVISVVSYVRIDANAT